MHWHGNHNFCLYLLNHSLKDQEGKKVLLSPAEHSVGSGSVLWPGALIQGDEELAGKLTHILWVRLAFGLWGSVLHRLAVFSVKLLWQEATEWSMFDEENGC